MTPASPLSSSQALSSQALSSQARGRPRTQGTSPASNTPACLPVCTHPSMTRVYSGRYFSCAICHKPGQWGWLFRCTLDREEMIEHYHQQGIFQIGFDDVGDSLVDRFMGNGPRKGTAAARQDDSIFLKEMLTSAGPTTYSPAQISVILQQRSNVKRVLEKHHEHAWAPPKPPPPPPGIDAALELGKMHNRPPWVAPDAQECQYKVCARCRPSFRDRAYLSLDGILRGDVPPTAACGFGYHLLKQRPVAAAHVVRNLGLRRLKPPPSERETLSWRIRKLQERTAATGWQIYAARESSSSPLENPGPDDDDLDMPPYRPRKTKSTSMGGDTKSNGVVQATQVPLPDQSTYEKLSLEGKATDMMTSEDEAGAFSSMPLEVDRGVAVMEEAVTKGIADIVTGA